MDQDLEGELGIDTVKQAEIMAEIRDHFALPVDEDFVLSDHPTLNHFTAYIVKMQGGEPPVDEGPKPTEQSAVASVTSSRPIVTGTRRWQVEIEACQASRLRWRPRAWLLFPMMGGVLRKRSVSGWKPEACMLLNWI